MPSAANGSSLDPTEWERRRTPLAPKPTALADEKHRSFGLLIAIQLLWFGHSIALAQIDSSVITQAAITPIAEIQRIPLDQIRQAQQRVRLRGTLTYQPPNTTQWFFLQEGDAAIQVFAGRTLDRFTPGRQLEVEGTIETSSFTAFVADATVTNLGEGSLPEPVMADFDGLAQGRYHARYIQVSGSVIDVCAESGNPIFLNNDGNNTYNISIAERHEGIPYQFWNGLITARGVAISRTDHAGRPSGFYVVCNDFSQIDVHEYGGPNPFDRPTQSARQLREIRVTTDERRKVSGVVTYTSPRGWFTIEDSTGPITLAQIVPMPKRGRQWTFIPRNDPAILPKRGDLVEAIGSLAVLPRYSPSLSYTEYHVIGTAPLPQPVAATAETLASGELDHLWITLEARVVGVESSLRDGIHLNTLWLQAADLFLRANLYHTNATPAPASPGDRVHITALSWVDAVEGPRSRTIHLYPDTPENVVVLAETTPWLTPAVFRVAGGAGLLLLGTLAWVRLLRRNVARQAVDLRTSESLRLQSEERFKTAFRASPAMMSITRLENGQFIAVNDAFLKTSGHNENEVVGHLAHDLNIYVHDSQRQEFVELLKTHGVASNREHLMRTKDGRHLTLLVTGEVLPIDGEPHALVVAVDISDRKQAESDIRRALDSERELGELRTRFVSLVSHEFRTPLGITMSAVELLRNYDDRLLPAKRTELLNDIHQSTLRMSGLMEEVLLLGRVASGRIAFKPSPIDLLCLTARLVDENNSATHARCPVKFTLDNPETLQAAMGDAALIRHIFKNLLSNAVKYSNVGDVVHLHIRREGHDAIFDVIDHGIGIPDTDRAQLYEPFHRGSNVSQTPGTGLGLLIVRRCVELHHGSISLESKEGQGTHFTVRLPLFRNQLPL